MASTATQLSWAPKQATGYVGVGVQSEMQTAPHLR